MRTLGIFFLIPYFAAASRLSDHYSNVPIKEIVESVMKVCAKEYGVTEDEIARIHDFSPELSHRREAKCFVSCIFYKFGEFDEGTDKPEEDTIDLDLATSYKPEDQKKVKQISRTCLKTVPKQPDHCEYLFSILECFTKATNAAKLKAIPFWDVPSLMTSR